MKLTEDQVRYVADLANLALSSDEVRRLCADLGDILTHMEKLNELDTSGVEPMAQVLYHTPDETATLREDTPGEILGNEQALANAPLAGAGFFKVPKVVEK